MIARFHTEAAIELNRWDAAKERRVWFQYWDKTLTFEGSWLARLKYTHENAVHHGLVRDASQYPWCSASWFEKTAPPAFLKTVARMKIDTVKVYDEFEAVATPPHS
jgi:putative transposase